jgi:hypothetical protein
MMREECSLGRRGVDRKAKFGILEMERKLPQLAMAKFFQNSDFRSGYH